MYFLELLIARSKFVLARRFHILQETQAQNPWGVLTEPSRCRTNCLPQQHQSFLWTHHLVFANSLIILTNALLCVCLGFLCPFTMSFYMPLKCVIWIFVLSHCLGQLLLLTIHFIIRGKMEMKYKHFHFSALTLKVLTNHRMVLGHHMRIKICTQNVSWTNCKNLWTHSLLSVLGVPVNHLLLKEFLRAQFLDQDIYS